jgi:hypothetical protein
MSDFWSDLTSCYIQDSSMDDFLSTKTTKQASHSVRELTDSYRDSITVKLPIEAGTRVAFITNLGSVLTYDKMPEPHTEGTVVKVRTASGDTTAVNGLVFVQWDRGGVIPIRAEHLSREVSQASSMTRKAFVRRVADIEDLNDFFQPRHRSLLASLGSIDDSGELIHKATRDLWSFRKDGEFWVIERLFEEDGNPIKA